jgi:hypothetical protein
MDTCVSFLLLALFAVNMRFFSGLSIIVFEAIANVDCSSSSPWSSKYGVPHPRTDMTRSSSRTTSSVRRSGNSNTHLNISSAHKEDIADFQSAFKEFREQGLNMIREMTYVGPDEALTTLLDEREKYYALADIAKDAAARIPEFVFDRDETLKKNRYEALNPEAKGSKAEFMYNTIKRTGKPFDVRQ